MCRIAGMVNAELPFAVREGTVRDMCTLQQHGGPDGSGIHVSSDDKVIFGHRRLALLDLSPAGHQPLQFKDYLFISYNGELYNFRELRKELISFGQQFRSDSDTEVILAAYDQWGVRAFEKFKGMFAFALADERSKQIFLVRDPSGIKPLYYSVAFRSLVFASEVRAFQAVKLPFENDPTWKVMLLAYGHIPEPQTTIREVKMLPKGCYLCYDWRKEKADLFSFSHFGYNIQGDNQRTDIINCLHNKLKASVARHLIADVPVGVFLSGGLDSSILYSLAVSSGKSDMEALSVYFDESGFSEKKYQDIVIEKSGKSARQYRLNFEEFEASFPRVLKDMDMPSCDGINTWFISKFARESGMKAVLSGIGADELFGGYPSFRRMKTAGHLQHLPSFMLRGAGSLAAGKWKRLAYLQLKGMKGLYLSLRGHFEPAGIARFLEMNESEVWEQLRNQSFPENTGSLKNENKACWMEMNLYMQNQLLRDADVMSMKHGVEVRVPFLDNDLIGYVLKIDPSVKFSGTYSKQLLIDTFREIIPVEVWKRPKMGFSLPYAQWIRKSHHVSEVMESSGGCYAEALHHFRKDKLSWSQLLSLLLVRNHAHA